MTAADDDTVQWRQLLDEATDALRSAGIEDATTEARRLVERASGSEGAELVVALDRPATNRGVAHLDAMLGRRTAGEPLQYVLGSWGFRTLDLLVDSRVLIPRPETEVVVGLALDVLDHTEPAGDRPLVVDLGTGSGAIALAIAVERPRTVVWATDHSADALEVVRANLAGVGRAGTRVRLAHGSWFEALPAELAGTIDLVVSNPPYIGDDEPLPPDVDEWEPRGALRAGPAGTEAIERILGDAPGWLAPRGSVVIELAPHQADAMVDAARRAGFDEVRVELDLARRPRVLVARRSLRR